MCFLMKKGRKSAFRWRYVLPDEEGKEISVPLEHL